jgi:hypothetical protein
MDPIYTFLYEPDTKKESQPNYLYLELPKPELIQEYKEEEAEQSSVIIIELM